MLVLVAQQAGQRVVEEVLDEALLEVGALRDVALTGVRRHEVAAHQLGDGNGLLELDLGLELEAAQAVEHVEALGQLGRRGRHPLGAQLAQVDEVIGDVAGHHLVGALAVEQHGDVLRGLAHHLELRIRPRGDERLLLGADEVDQVGLELVGRRCDLVRVDVTRADVEHVVDVALLVVDRAGEHRREGVLAGADRPGRQLVALVEQLVDDHRDRARVEAAGQAGAHRDLRLQPQPHRLHEPPLVLRGRRVVVGALLRRELEQLLPQAGEHPPPDAVAVSLEQLARCEALDAVEERLGAVLVGPEAQVAVDRALVDLLLVEPALQDRCDLAGEQQHLAVVAGGRDPGDVERLDAEVVAGQGEPTLLAVPDGQAEHAVEPVEGLGPPLGERLEHDLGVGVGGEGAA